MTSLNALLQLQDPILRRVLAVWEAAAASEAGWRVPSRSAVDPIQLGRALPHVWLCEREAGGRFRYRLAGERINEIYKGSLAGRYLDEIIPEPGITIVRRRYREVLDLPAVTRTAGLVYPRNQRVLVGERLILPLVSDLGGGDLVLGATVYGLAEPLQRPAPEQLHRVARLRPLPGDPGWVENKDGEKLSVLE